MSSLITSFAFFVGLVLLVACGDDDTRTGAPMDIVETAEVDHFIRSGVASGDRLFLVTSAGEEDQVALRTFEVDGNGSLEELGSLTAPGTGHNFTYAVSSGIALADDVAYVPLGGSDQPGLWVVDVSNPETPEELAFVNLEATTPQSVDVEGDLAVVSGLIGSNIILLDVSTAGDPQVIAGFPYSAVSETHVEIDSDHAFVSDRSGVAVIDISSPNAPQEIAFYENVNWTGPSTGEDSETGSISPSDPVNTPTPDVAINGEYLYLANGESGLEVLSIEDPANLERVARLDMEVLPINLTAVDDTAYLLARGNLEFGASDIPFVIQRLDISNPENPEMVDELTDVAAFPAHTQSLVAGNDYIYFLDRYTISVVGEAE